MKKLIAIISGLSIAVLIGLGNATLADDQDAAEEADVGPITASELVGLWQGFTDLEGREIRVEIKISKNAEGELSGVVDLRDTSTLGVPLEVEFAGDTVNLSTGSGSFFKGRLSDDLRAIQGELFVATKDSWYSLVLKRDNDAFRRFEVPRLTDAGAIQRTYSYRPPRAAEDGWAVSSLDAEAIDEGQITSLVESVLREEQGLPEAILIARNGKLVLEEYFHGYSRDRIHPIQSVTKSVMSLLLGIAQDGGFVGGMDEPVYTFFPEHAGKKWIDRKYPITLANLLTMSAAIDWNDVGGESGHDFESTAAMHRSGDWIGYVLDQDQAGVPGKVASYTGGLSILLGGVIRNATGKYADEFAEETLFADLHVSSYRWQKARDGTRETGGGLTLTAYDLAKMGQLVLDKGMWNGKRVVSDTWIAESVKRHLPLAEGALGGSPYTTGFAYHWWIQRYEVNGKTIQAIVGRGYGGQYLGIFPALNTVVVMNNGEWGNPRERVFDYDVIVEKWILPAIR
ncbi:MAG: serine hydrolase [Proteobacteria bacterium]|nr:serine hydrolase [Pseudomonadota bacterium]